MTRQPWLRLGIVAALFIAATTALHVLGVGGYRQGGLIVTGVLLVVGCGTFLALPGRGNAANMDNRGLWLLVLGVLAVVGGGVLADRAAWSSGRLASEMDRLDLPFFEVRDERTTGHSWCRPSCPAVIRVYGTPNTSVRATMLTVAASFTRIGLVTDQTLLSRIGDEPTAQLRTDRVVINVEVGDVEDQARRVEIRYRAIRGG